MNRSFRALRHRNFRLFILGQGTSQIGTWLQLIATSWLIYKLSGSTFLLGLAAFALQIPILLLAPVAAVWIDRLPKRRVLFGTQLVALLQSGTMFLLVSVGHIEAWHLVAGNLVLGVVNAFDGPGRQSFLIEMVEGKEDLPNAIALQSSIMNGARFVGPMVGGAVIAVLGEPWGFGLNALSYLAVLGALAAMNVKPRDHEVRNEAWLTQFTAGFRWAFGFLPTRSVLVLLAVTSFSLHPYQSLMPWFAKEVHGGDSRTLGWLIAAAGCGAVSGMIYLATRSSVRGLLGLLPVAGAAAGLTLVAFAFSTTLWLALPLAWVTGLGLMLVAAGTNTILQTIVEDRLRARVAAIYMMCFLGMSPLGALAAGWAAQYLGPPLAVAIGGGIALLAAALYARKLPEIRRAIRPVYERLGVTGPGRPS